MESLTWEDQEEDSDWTHGEGSDVPDEPDLEFLLYSQLHYDQADENEVSTETAPQCNSQPNSSAPITKKDSPTSSVYNSVSNILVEDKNSNSDIRTAGTGKQKTTKVDTIRKQRLKRLKETSPEIDKAKKRRKVDSETLQKILMVDSSDSSSDIEIVNKFGKKDKKSRKETVTVEHDSVLEPCTSCITISSDSSDSDCEIVESDIDSDDELGEGSIIMSGSSDSESGSCSSIDTTHLQVHVDPDQMNLLQSHKDQQKEKWKINEEDRLAGIIGNRESVGKRFGGTGVGGRYYRPSSVKCLNCMEIGHLSKDCPKPKKSHICILCGFTGHYFRDCPQSLCYNCNLPGHTAKECEVRRQGRYQECLRCNMTGHYHKDCPERWRQFHLTTVVSKQCPVKGQAHVNFRRCCYNCASKKHFGHECPRERVDRYSSPTYPLIAKYDAWNVIKTFILPEIATGKESKREKFKQKRKEKKKKKLERRIEDERSLYESKQTGNPNKGKIRKKKSKQKNWDSKFSTCSDTGKLFKNSKKKRKQANLWRNKQGTSVSCQRSVKGFKVSTAVQMAQKKMQH